MDNYRQLEVEKNREQKVSFSNKRLKKILIPIISVILLSFIIAFPLLYKPVNSLEGVWVRQPDDNAMASGMVIRIEKNNGICVGEVIAIDNELEMPIGTYKWNDFQKDALNVFTYYDMTLSANPLERFYSTGHALISLDGKKLTIYCPGVSLGAHQVWIRE